MIIDSHCHIDLYQNPIEILKKSIDAEHTVISMTNLPSHFEMGYPHFVSLKKIRLALGMHPLMADFHRTEFDLFIKNVQRTSYIGEIGLDFSREGISTKDVQLETFNRILKTISGQKKILSIHSRRAEKEVLSLLIEHKVKGAIFHWYSGPIALIDQITESGYYLSINPAMIKSESGQKIVQRIPSDKVLTETDGPFIEDQGKPIKPGEVKKVIQYLSSLWNISPVDVELKISSNFKEMIQFLRD